MTNDNQPIRVQFAIGKTSSLDLQEWADNQTLPISKAIKEALEHFVRTYGTQDISSNEVRRKLATPAAMVLSPTISNGITDNATETEVLKEHEVVASSIPERQKKVEIEQIDRGLVDIDD